MISWLSYEWHALNFLLGDEVVRVDVSVNIRHYGRI